MTYLYLAVGFALLLFGGELLVRGAVGVARRLGVSPFAIGLLLVGFGTSMPELVASVDAALAGAPGLAVGNVVGSNIANVLLILGLGATLRPLRTTRAAFLRDGTVLLAASLLVVLVCWIGTIDRATGAAFLALLLAYVAYTTWHERRRPDASAEVYAAEAAAVGGIAGSLGAGLVLALGGLAGVLVGAKLMVDAAIELARLWGVSEAIIGLSVVALGTSLPELATLVVSAYRKQGDVAFGNVVGSNIFNSLGILGTTALVEPLAVPAVVARFDVWVMLGVTMFAVAFALTGWRITRAEGAALLFAYLAYLVVIWS